MTQLLINILIQGSIYCLLALGFNLILRTVKFFHVFYGSVAVLGAYVAYALLKLWSWPISLAIPLGILSSSLVGVLSYQYIYLPLKKRGAKRLVFLLASFGLFTVFQGLFSIIWSSQFQALADAKSPPKAFEILGGNFNSIHVYLFISTLLIILCLIILDRYTSLGRAIRAISDDEEVAKISGINTEVVIRKVFFIGSAISAVAGIFIGFDTGIEPITGLPVILKAIIASIIGGVGNIYGSILGAFLLSGAENVGVWFLAAEWRDLIAFSVLILFLIFKPTGLVGKSK